MRPSREIAFQVLIIMKRPVLKWETEMSEQDPALCRSHKNELDFQPTLRKETEEK